MKNILISTGSLTLGLLLLVVPVLVLADEQSDENEQGNTPSLEICTDGIDNDNDGVIDAQDSDCAPYYRVLSVVNHVVGSTTSPSAWNFTVAGVGNPGLGTFAFEADGENNFLETLTGEYSVSESALPGFTTTYDNCGSGTLGDNALTIPVNGLEETCTITNTWIASNESTTTETGTTTDSGGSSPSSGGGSSHHSHSSSTAKKGGEVLGASSCGALLGEYIGKGKNNNPDAVKTLQSFLSKELGIDLPQTGLFDDATEGAVNAFQIKYWQDVLLPWMHFGLPSDHTATGYVYKTTLHKINHLFCASLEDTLPVLP